ncbi:hypothetical protein GOODEAATRI_027894 [Goodea atripinnis]|uniref:Uncharacterized protein n=1 Tax=Goodea atripinnis TaxID=208336 RepID=A0ABV0PHL5_9TELE
MDLKLRRLSVLRFLLLARLFLPSGTGFPLVLAPEPRLTLVFGVRPCVSEDGLCPSSPVIRLGQQQITSPSLPSPYQKKAVKMDFLPEDEEDLCNVADTILNLCEASTVCSSCIAGWQTLLQPQMWLHLYSSISEDLIKELLEGLIIPDGLVLCWSNSDVS